MNILPCITPSILVGQLMPLPGDHRLTGIDKKPIAAPWHVSLTGLHGDAQADLKNHGGAQKAIHHYPHEHYAEWASEIGAHPLFQERGAFGENISTTGWTESNVCIGDIVQFGSATLQVSQGRQPCWKLNKRFGREDMAQAIQKSGRTGWYYRVLEEGTAGDGDRLSLLERPQPEWPLSRLIRLLYVDTKAWSELAAMAVLPELAEGWRKLAERRVNAKSTEDWSARLGH